MRERKRERASGERERGAGERAESNFNAPPPLCSRVTLFSPSLPFPFSLSFYSSKDVVVPARGRAIVPTGLSIAAPPGTYARVAPRSGLAVKHFIDTGAGVVDEDYRGEVGVVLFNHSEQDFNVAAGDRVAQLILERIVTPAVVCGT